MLYLSYNVIGDEGAKYLGAGLSNLVDLTILSLDLGHNKIGDEGASNLGAGISN